MSFCWLPFVLSWLLPCTPPTTSTSKAALFVGYLYNCHANRKPNKSLEPHGRSTKRLKKHNIQTTKMPTTTVFATCLYFLWRKPKHKD